MAEDEQRELLVTIRQCQGKVMLSGYHSQLYDDTLSDWTLKEFNKANNASGAKEKRRMVECLWMNY